MKLAQVVQEKRVGRPVLRQNRLAGAPECVHGFRHAPPVLAEVMVAYDAQRLGKHQEKESGRGHGPTAR
jgi:hypothetical protein